MWFHIGKGKHLANAMAIHDRACRADNLAIVQNRLTAMPVTDTDVVSNIRNFHQGRLELGLYVEG